MKPYHHINYFSLLCLNLIKKPLFECAMARKNFAWHFQILQNNNNNNKFRYKNF